MSLDRILILVRSRLGDGTGSDASARVCLADAIACADRGLNADARTRALKALAYQVGVFHADYVRASKGGAS